MCICLTYCLKSPGFFSVWRMVTLRRYSLLLLWMPLYFTKYIEDIPSSLFCRGSAPSSLPIPFLCTWSSLSHPSRPTTAVCCGQRLRRWTSMCGCRVDWWTWAVLACRHLSLRSQPPRRLSLWSSCSMLLSGATSRMSICCQRRWVCRWAADCHLCWKLCAVVHWPDRSSPFKGFMQICSWNKCLTDDSTSLATIKWQTRASSGC